MYEHLVSGNLVPRIAHFQTFLCGIGSGKLSRENTVIFINEKVFYNEKSSLSLPARVDSLLRVLRRVHEDAQLAPLRRACASDI